MDTGKFKKLNAYHVVFLTQNTMVGVSLFSLPNDMSQAGYNLWLLPIILGLLSNLALIPIIYLCKQYPNDTLFKINEKLLGSLFGKVLNFFVFSYAVIALASVSQRYLRLVQTVTLPEYTITWIAIVFFAVLICIVMGGIKSIARFCMFSFFFTAWLIYYLKWALQSGNWLHAVPTFEVSGLAWLHALHNGAPAMFGFGLILFYYPYIINQEKAFLHVSIGIWIAVFFYFAVSLASVVYFSSWQLSNLLFPVLNLFQAVQLAFLERIETFGTSLWTFLALSTASAYLWVGKKGIDSLLSNHKNRTWHLYICAVVGLILFNGPIPFYLQIKIFEKWLVYYGYGIHILPVVLLILHSFKKDKEKGVPL
ncbi:GerAB/ArcD/ProY family transporter [Alkalihalobacterium elongatum]|uniref:GerAB/ArcD/ProY family transporter n=1 Tax=Alkalihalobacterium elongatum TaxID=2675466 RepID=UPI001C1FBB97|nr:GerAB/ArcD/ProY family transporter [Alkalihalobacterium elongatum]